MLNYFFGDDNMARLNEEATEEIIYLIDEVKDIVRLLKEFGINITSDPWTATSFCSKENILTWGKKDLNKINNDSKINIGDKFYVGGNIVTGYQHEYKGMPLIAPKELAEVQGEVFKQYLESIVDKISLKHFDLEFRDDYGLTDNCGWEHYLCITATVKKSALQTDKTTKLIKEIMNEEDHIIELSGSPLYTNPKSNFNEDSGLVPQGDFPYMVEFFSDLIIDEDTIYQGTFGLNSKYIKDAMKLINQVEKRAEELANKYSDKGVKVTVNGLNDGCEKGMAVYVWIPYQ